MTTALPRNGPVVKPAQALSRIAVFGANGRTGRLVVEKLLEAGYQVTAAVRDPAGFSTSAPHASDGRGAQIVHGDIRDPLSVHEAVAGQHAVVSAIGSGRRPDGLYSASARALVPALQDTGVKRLLVISSSGAPLGDPGVSWIFRALIRPLFFRDMYADMRVMESIVQASSLAWTLVRPARLTDAAPTGHYRVADGKNPPGGATVTRSDLADFIVATLADNSWSQGTPTLAQ